MVDLLAVEFMGSLLLLIWVLSFYKVVIFLKKKIFFHFHGVDLY